MQNILTTVFQEYLLMGMPKSLVKKKRNEEEPTLAELSSAHSRSQAKCQLVQTPSSHKRNELVLVFAIYVKKY